MHLTSFAILRAWSRVLKWMAIAASIALAATKTLAKVATVHAKKKTGCQVFKLLEAKQIELILKDTPLQDIWGIARGIDGTLRRQGFFAAWDFIQMDDGWIRLQLGVVGLRMAMELRGTPRFDSQDEVPAKKTIIRSRFLLSPYCGRGKVK